MPDPTRRRRQELDLRLALTPLLLNLQGPAGQALEENCDRARELCRTSGSAEELFQVLYALCHVYSARADRVHCPAVMAELTDLAETLKMPEWRVLGDSIRARVACHEARFAEACQIVEKSRLAPLGTRPSAAPIPAGADAVLGAQWDYALALWFLGHIDRAESIIRSAVSEAQPVGGFTATAALGHLAIFSMLCRQPEAVRTLADEVAGRSAEHGFHYWQAMAAALRGWAHVQEGEVQQGIEMLERARTMHWDTGARLFSTHIGAFLAEAHLRAGTLTAGLAAVGEGLALAEATTDRTYWPELWRLKGELLAASAAAHAGSHMDRAADRSDAETLDPPGASAEACLLHAVETARQAESRSLELRATTSLARAWQARGRSGDAYTALDRICQWFGPGVTSPDLADARTLLALLTPAPPSPAPPGTARAARSRTRPGTDGGRRRSPLPFSGRRG
jgi:hypothetical protein